VSRFANYRRDQEHVRVLLVLHPVANGVQHSKAVQLTPNFTVSMDL